MDSVNSHDFKKSVVAEYAEKYHLWTLVETGTYRGFMVEWASSAGNFDKVISIELSEHYFKKASEYLGVRNNVQLILGDSSKVLQGVVAQSEDKALFWLDAHYSGGKTAKGTVNNPVLDELTHILGDKRFRHVILLDDERLFGKDGWPSIAQLISHINSLRLDAEIAFKNDIIRVT